MFRISTFLLCLFSVSAISANASAQTNDSIPPKTESFRKTESAAAKPAPKSTTTTTTPVKKSPVSIGLNWIFNFGSNTNETVAGKDATNTTSFLRLEPQFEFYITPETPLTLSAGWLRRSINREGGETSASNELLLLLGGAYHLPVTNTFSLIGSAGLGGYFGSSEQTIKGTMGKTINETTSTVGFGGNVGLGAGQQFSDHGQFRAGVTYTGLFGSESIESTGKSFPVTTHNVALNIALFYSF